jgi:hypothetical protein
VTAARSGPLATTTLSCEGCVHEHSESYAVQGDSGFEVSCRHPDVNEGALRRIGDTTWRTPKWCPLRPATYEELRAELEELKATTVASQTGDMLKVIFRTLIGSSTNPGAKNYAACHVEWDDGVFSELNLPFQRIQFALIKPNAQSPTEKLGMAEARALVAERRVAELEARLAGAAAELNEADASVAAALGMTEHVPPG